MKKIVHLVLFLFFSFSLVGQNPGEWVWLHGSNLPNSTGTYGVQGIPSSTNNPHGLYEACEWTDADGNFWLFGGWGPGGGIYSDLWKYDLALGMWTWMNGPGTPGSAGNFGTLGVPSITN